MNVDLLQSISLVLLGLGMLLQIREHRRLTRRVEHLEDLAHRLAHIADTITTVRRD